MLTAGNDMIFGDDGEDLILADSGSVVVPFAADNPTEDYMLLRTRINGNVFGNDFDYSFYLHFHNIDKQVQVFAQDMVYGGNEDDVIYGQEGNDNLFGNNGNDMLFGGLGLDSLDGGSGDNVTLQTGSIDPVPEHAETSPCVNTLPIISRCAQSPV